MPLQLHRISPSYHETELATKELHYHGVCSQYVFDQGQIVLTRGRIQNMRGCEISDAIANSS